MKKLIIIALLFTVPVWSQAQSVSVHFEQNLSWKQVLAKARAEHKYVFVDCYATWCGPCKKMDAEVYPNDSVGTIVNKNFIAVKVQFDTSKLDNEMIKSWYADAHRIMKDYKVNAFPSYLFFDGDGQIVHRAVAYQKTADFIKIATEAADPAKQFYTQLRLYQTKKVAFQQMPNLVAMAKKFNERELALTIAADYERNYLDKLPDAAFFTKANFEFIGSNSELITSKDRAFDWYFHRSAEVDTLFHSKGYSKSFVDYVIYKEQITPELDMAKSNKREPDWATINSSIGQTYGQGNADFNILNAKVNWYRSQKDWKNYTHYLVEKCERDHIEDGKGFWGAVGLGDTAWDIFQHSDNKDELEKALYWSDLAVQTGGKNDFASLDTKANILYKLGRKKEALEFEQKAATGAVKDKGIQETYQKMLQGLPTWPVNAIEK